MAKITHERVGKPFIASTKSGTKFEIHAVAKVTYVQTSKGEHRNEGAKHFYTADGREVAYLAKGHYQIDGGRELFSNDPNAP